MTTVRLTNFMREAITTKVLRHRFNDEIIELIDQKGAFAMALYEDIYSKNDRKLMASLKKGWLYEASNISAQFGDSNRYVNVSFSGYVTGILNRARSGSGDYVSTHLRVIDNHRNGCAKVFDNDHALSLRNLELISLETDLRQKVEAAERQILSALSNVSTISQLLKVWPEVEPFVKDYAEEPVRLPSVPVNDLNKLLDLPVLEQEAA